MTRQPRKKAPISKEADAKTVGDRVRDARVKAGLSQSQLARLCGMVQSRIAEIEAGESDPRLSTVRRVAEALSIPISDLLPPK
jgi:HTH-type transcriptional regulator, competence development regulator